MLLDSLFIWLLVKTDILMKYSWVTQKKKIKELWLVPVTLHGRYYYSGILCCKRTVAIYSVKFSATEKISVIVIQEGTVLIRDSALLKYYEIPLLF